MSQLSLFSSEPMFHVRSSLIVGNYTTKAFHWLDAFPMDYFGFLIKSIKEPEAIIFCPQTSLHKPLLVDILQILFNAKDKPKKCTFFKPHPPYPFGIATVLYLTNAMQ